MGKKEDIESTIQEFVLKSNSDLLDALNRSLDPPRLLRACVYVLGYTKVASSQGAGRASVTGSGLTKTDLSIEWEQSTKLLAGNFASEVQSVFAVIREIEGPLTEAINLPHEMRQRRIDQSIQKCRVTPEFYSLVLGNLKTN